MANELLNPYQQFRDDGGRPLARGTLEFFENGQTVTQLDIFSDSDLTVAQSNPYTLDEFGRTRGDVRYEGLATIVVTNRNGIFIRQLDDVVSATDVIVAPINIESVGDMIARLTLIEGDVVKTESYHRGTMYGGARYLIVPGGTGTAENFTYINLGNGLQAELLDLDRNQNFLVAGAKGDDGSDDTMAMQAVIDRGGDIVVEGGFTFVSRTLSITRNVRFIGSGAMKLDNSGGGDLFRIETRDVTVVKFKGVTIDGNEANGNGANSSIGWILE